MVGRVLSRVLMPVLVLVLVLVLVAGRARRAGGAAARGAAQRRADLGCGIRGGP